MITQLHWSFNFCTHDWVKSSGRCYFCTKARDMAEKSSLLSLFLIDGKYRFWRYLFFGIVGAIIISSMVFVAYMDCSVQLGTRIYLLCLSSCIVYAIAMLLNYHYLVPAFLLKGKYITYSVLLFGTAYLLPTLSILQEYFVRNAWGLPHRISNYKCLLIWVDNLSSSMLLLVCFLGVSAIMLFRQWKKQEEQLNRMEYAHLQAEVNKLKGLTTPSFLSETLQRASNFVSTDATKANEMLMQLGKVLRYQLYDCNRDEVLLSSEIRYLHSLLRIKQLLKDGFEYEIETIGQPHNLFIPPLLFTALIQDAAGNSTSLKISFTCDVHSLSFRCGYDRDTGISDHAIASLRRRLDLQFPERYALVSEAGITELKIALP